MRSDVERFALLGGSCPVCGADMKLVAGIPVDESERWWLQWSCDKHLTCTGKPVVQPMCTLIVENVTRDEFDAVIEAVKGKRDPALLPPFQSEMKVYDLQLQVMNLTLMLPSEVPVTRYIEQGRFDFLSWFKDWVQEGYFVQPLRNLLSAVDYGESGIVPQMYEILNAALYAPQMKGGGAHS